ncbi:MAG: NUDIX domain-containing protein [Patescibacteria group bacterium]|nr:NUDIX domain-containing protein [Patescibacteria group bacterium]
MNQKFDSSFGIITYKGKLLLLLRDNNPNIPAPNTWTVIGGAPEEDETPEQTFVREVKEETNIDLTDFNFLFVFNLEGEEKYVFHSKLNQKQSEQIKLGNEGQRLDFFSFEEIRNLPLARTTLNFYKKHDLLLKKLLTDSKTASEVPVS